MSGFIEFGSLDEMFAAQAEAEKVANDNVLPKQREITWGTYWMRPTDDGIIIWGYVMTLDEVIQEEIEYSYPDEPEVDPTAIRSHFTERYERGYRYGRAHSLWCPEGELGDSHISVLWPITKEDFELAKTSGWNPGPTEMFNQMLRRVIHEYQEAHGE